MASHIVILGAGTGGTLTANRLHRELGEAVRITVVDQDDSHVYQPGLLFVPFGLAAADAIVRSRRAQLHDGIDFRLAGVDRVEVGEHTVHLVGGERLSYDVLVIATGARLLPGETEGLDGPWAGTTVHTFYDLPGARALHEALEDFTGGRVVVDVVDMPIKCPVAPLEFCFLADWYFRQRGIRDRVQLTYVTPLDAAFTKPIAARTLSGLLAEKDVHLETEFAAGRVDGERGELVSWDERTIGFDLLVAVPAHGGAAYVERSPGLGDPLGFVPSDPHTLQARAAEDVFVIGDATDIPASKAGSVTHFEGETVVENIRRHLAGEALDDSYDGHANCFIETGFGKALLIDFNYDVEPGPGRFPDPHFGPLPLMAESRLNHMGKLMFEWVYWHVLLPGRDMPGVSAQLQTTGRDDAPD